MYMCYYYINYYMDRLLPIFLCIELLNIIETDEKKSLVIDK